MYERDIQEGIGYVTPYERNNPSYSSVFRGRLQWICRYNNESLIQIIFPIVCNVLIS
jgi:hypothetical protein